MLKARRLQRRPLFRFGCTPAWLYPNPCPHQRLKVLRASPGVDGQPKNLIKNGPLHSFSVDSGHRKVQLEEESSWSDFTLCHESTWIGNSVRYSPFTGEALPSSLSSSSNTVSSFTLCYQEYTRSHDELGINKILDEEDSGSQGGREGSKDLLGRIKAPSSTLTTKSLTSEPQGGPNESQEGAPCLFQNTFIGSSASVWLTGVLDSEGSSGFKQHRQYLGRDREGLAVFSSGAYSLGPEDLGIPSANSEVPLSKSVPVRSNRNMEVKFGTPQHERGQPLGRRQFQVEQCLVAGKYRLRVISSIVVDDSPQDLEGQQLAVRISDIQVIRELRQGSRATEASPSMAASQGKDGTSASLLALRLCTQKVRAYVHSTGLYHLNIQDSQSNQVKDSREKRDGGSQNVGDIVRQFLAGHATWPVFVSIAYRREGLEAKGLPYPCTTPEQGPRHLCNFSDDYSRIQYGERRMQQLGFSLRNQVAVEPHPEDRVPYSELFLTSEDVNVLQFMLKEGMEKQHQHMEEENKEDSLGDNNMQLPNDSNEPPLQTGAHIVPQVTGSVDIPGVRMDDSKWQGMDMEDADPFLTGNELTMGTSNEWDEGEHEDGSYYLPRRLYNEYRPLKGGEHEWSQDAEEFPDDFTICFHLETYDDHVEDHEILDPPSRSEEMRGSELNLFTESLREGHSISFDPDVWSISPKGFVFSLNWVLSDGGELCLKRKYNASGHLVGDYHFMYPPTKQVLPHV